MKWCSLDNKTQQELLKVSYSQQRLDDEIPVVFCNCLSGLKDLTHLGLGHVQQTHRVTVTVEERSDRVQGLVELPLYVCQLLKHLTGWPQQHLDGGDDQEHINVV